MTTKVVLKNLRCWHKWNTARRKKKWVKENGLKGKWELESLIFISFRPQTAAAIKKIAGAAQGEHFSATFIPEVMQYSCYNRFYSVKWELIYTDIDRWSMDHNKINYRSGWRIFVIQTLNKFTQFPSSLNAYMQCLS